MNTDTKQKPNEKPEEERLLEKLQRLEYERHQLYKAAGNRTISPKQRERIGEISAELYEAWDAYRREVAAVRRGEPSDRQGRGNTSAA
jgi:hypothetical protein